MQKHDSTVPGIPSADLQFQTHRWLKPLVTVSVTNTNPTHEHTLAGGVGGAVTPLGFILAIAISMGIIAGFPNPTQGQYLA